jgi:hypothetical protein
MPASLLELMPLISNYKTRRSLFRAAGTTGTNEPASILPVLVADDGTILKTADE